MIYACMILNYACLLHQVARPGGIMFSRCSSVCVCVCVRPSQRMQSPIRLPSTCKFQLVNLQTFSSDGRTGPPIYATAPMVGGLARSRLVVLTRRSLCIQDTAQLVTSTMQFCMLGTMGHPPGHFPPSPPPTLQSLSRTSAACA